MSDGSRSRRPGEAGRLISVSVGAPRPVLWRDRTVFTAIFKCAVEGRVAVAGVNLDGDDQADREVHGGPDKAVYAYAREDIDWWAGEIGRPLRPGNFGENLTTVGLPVSSAEITEASSIVGDVARLTAGNSAQRIAQRITSVRGLLTPWEQTASVRKLDERLAAYRPALAGGSGNTKRTYTE